MYSIHLDLCKVLSQQLPSAIFHPLFTTDNCHSTLTWLPAGTYMLADYIIVYQNV